MNRSAFLLAATAILTSIAPITARATDVPVAANELWLVRAPGGARVVYASRDPAFPFPAIGGSDAPTAVGLTFEVFTAATPKASLFLPATYAKPGWRARDAAIHTYTFSLAATVGRAAQRSVVFRQGTLFRLRAGGLDLPLTAPLESVVVRVTTGALRSCAAFSGASVKHDAAGRFSAHYAPAPALPDCSDASVAIALGESCTADGDWPTCGGTCPSGGTCVSEVSGGCRCVFATQPCGETYPVCGGECPAGEECRELGPAPFGSCACAPVGTTPCGAGPYPQCADECPPTETCAPGIYSILGQTVATCSCAQHACGSPDFGTCPQGYACAVVPGAPPTYACAPLS